MPDLRRMMTHSYQGSLTTTRGSLLQRPAGHRPPPRLLETLDGGACLGIVDARGLHRTVAEIGECALHRDDAAAGREQRRDRIVALDRDRLRLDGRAGD